MESQRQAMRKFEALHREARKIDFRVYDRQILRKMREIHRPESPFCIPGYFGPYHLRLGGRPAPARLDPYRSADPDAAERREDWVWRRAAEAVASKTKTNGNNR